MFLSQSLRTTFAAIATSTLLLGACNKAADNVAPEGQNTVAAKSRRGSCRPHCTPHQCHPACTSTCGYPFTIKLESTVNNGDGTFTWTWSVANPRPGNGYCGTIPPLHHWDIRLDNCEGDEGADISDVIGASYSADGVSYTPFTPTVASDPTLAYFGVSTGNVLRFNLGTNGTAKSYYRITVNRLFDVNQTSRAYYLLGTGCWYYGNATCFPGLGCPTDMEGGGE